MNVLHYEIKLIRFRSNYFESDSN